MIPALRPGLNGFRFASAGIRLHSQRTVNLTRTSFKVNSRPFSSVWPENEADGPALSAAAAAMAAERNIKLRETHHAYRDSYPKTAQPSDGSAEVDPLYAHKKKLIYRSKQRGWLEVDLLMGSWATDNVMSLNEDELKQYENIINQETLDIYNIVTKQMDPPEGCEGPILERLQEYALTSPAGIADPQKYSEIKKKMSN